MIPKKLSICLLLAIQSFIGSQLIAQSSSKLDSIYKLSAVSYLSTGKVDSAIYVVKKLNDKDPANQKDLLLATLYEKKADTAKSNAYFKKSLTALSADTAQIYFLRSMSYYRRGNIQAAKELLVISLQYDPAQAKRQFLLGKFYDYLKQPDSAAMAYKEAYRLEPDNLAYIQSLYSFYRGKGMIRESIPYLEKWAAADSSNLQSRLSLAVQWIEIDSFIKAAPILHRLIKRYSANDSIYYNWGICQLGSGDTVTGLQALRQAILLAAVPNFLYYDRLIAVYEAQGQIIPLMSTIQEAAQKGLVMYGSWLNEYKLSLAETRRLDSLLRQDNQPDQLKDLFMLASLSVIQKDDANALLRIKAYGQLAGTLPDSLLYIRCMAELGLGHLSDARSDIEQALRMTPGNAAYTSLLVTILYRSKAHGDLLKLLPAAPPAGLSDAEKEDRDAMLFKIYTALGDTENALRHYHGE